ncbi:60S ribosomal protein L4 [Anaeramoeba ignava]|uniref:60S ribosomal protein L4 n=1 Tax=Anaeramoeba ignava TaxID=1746090 RepID=A0A9Q0R7L2_ANAIG|nr:60S ribosomal protein L4 [Anaeramoeba ignava]|eukprot:Anaeramoba_ignava/a478239_365.p1 GENE.a478239_365~~a478239_365.p1  ORF type:complete len:379 (+),score=87.11 a478239_365:2058-3194(+)
MCAAIRPLVTVHSLTKDKPNTQVNLPTVFSAPIRPDIVRFVHTNMAKNSRQPHSVSTKAGEQTSAKSWGTGRAVARIPRISGHGTGRSGQGAFGNMCRGGRMYSPKKIWRRWHRRINLNQRRFAVCSAIAATALPSIVMARGHVINKVSEIPLVCDNSIEEVKKTKEAVRILRRLQAYKDVEKAKASKHIRAGKGKMRNRRYRIRRGPLVIYAHNKGIKRAFRNLPGVETCKVTKLNLLQLAPGSHLGRFCIWSQDAFETLNKLYGDWGQESQLKKGYHLPRPIMTNTDLTRIINSEEIQSVLRPKIPKPQPQPQRKNPLKHKDVMYELNPYAKTRKENQLALLNNKSKDNSQIPKLSTEEKKRRKSISKKFYQSLIQ